MRHHVILVLLSLGLSLSAAAQEQKAGRYDGPYVGVEGGLEFIDRGVENNIGFSYGAFAGYRSHVRDRVVVGAFGRWSESTTSELDISRDLNTEIADTWAIGGSVGYMFYSDYLISAEVGYAETTVNFRGEIIIDPLSPGGGAVTTDGDRIVDSQAEGGFQVGLVFERPFIDFVNIRTRISYSDIGTDVDRWGVNAGLVFHF